MKTTTRLLLHAAIVLCTFAACTDGDRYHSLLVEADSALMTGQYRAGDSILNKVPGNLAHKEAQAYRKLLSLERAFVYSTLSRQDYSLADSLSRYFASCGDTAKLAKSLCFLANIESATGDAPSAMLHYSAAIDVARHLPDRILRGWLLMLTGDLYFDQCMYDDCMPYYRKFCQLSESAGDTLRMALASFRMARVYTIADKADSTVYYYQRALELSGGLEQQEDISANAKYALCDIYIQTKQFDKAQRLMTHDSLNIANWAYWHWGQHHTDSAVFYFRKALYRDNIYAQAEYLRNLAHLEGTRGNARQALVYYEEYAKVADSIQESAVAEAVKKAEAQYNYHRIRQQRDSLAMKQQRMQAMARWIVLVTVLTFLLIIVLWMYYRKKKNLELFRERELRSFVEDRVRINEMELEENRLKIKQLMEDLEEAKSRNDTVKAGEIEVAARRLDAENTIIETELEKRKKSKSRLLNNPIVKKIRMHSGDEGFRMTDSEWDMLYNCTDKAFPGMFSRLQNLASLNKTELRICMLQKIGAHSSEIAHLTNKSRSAISMARKRMYQKLMGKEGSAELFNTFLDSL